MEKPFRDAPPGTGLSETMLWKPGPDVALAQRHQDRMGIATQKLGFAFDPSQFDATLAKVAGEAPLRLRLTLNATGQIEMTSAPAPAPAGLRRVAIASDVLDSGNRWLQVKSTRCSHRHSPPP